MKLVKRTADEVSVRQIEVADDRRIILYLDVRAAHAPVNPFSEGVTEVV